MARGRKPQGAGDVLSIRIPAKLRRSLEHAAKKNGKSLNHEIRSRLIRSFEADESVIEKYGNRQAAAFFRLLSLVVLAVEPWPRPERKDSSNSWLRDQQLYEQAAWGIRTVLEMLEPKGDPDKKREYLQTKTVEALNNSPQGKPTPEAQGRLQAAAVMHEIKNVDPKSWSTLHRVEIAIQQEMKDLTDRLPDATFSTAIRQLFTRKRII